MGKGQQIGALLDVGSRTWMYSLLGVVTLSMGLTILLLGGVQTLLRVLVALGLACIVMSIAFIIRLKWFLTGRARGWTLLIIGGVVFVLASKAPSTILPFKPMSLLDMVQPPLSWNLILVSMLLVLGFFVAIFSLARRR